MQKPSSSWKGKNTFGPRILHQSEAEEASTRAGQGSLCHPLSATDTRQSLAAKGEEEGTLRKTYPSVHGPGQGQEN